MVHQPVILWVLKEEKKEEARRIGEAVSRVGVPVVLHGAEKLEGERGQGVLVMASEAQDMGRAALALSARGLHGAVLYEERYLTTFGNGNFHTDEIAPRDFALPPRETWKEREALIWWTGLLLYAGHPGAGLLPCMDEARRLAR